MRTPPAPWQIYTQTLIPHLFRALLAEAKKNIEYFMCTRCKTGEEAEEREKEEKLREKAERRRKREEEVGVRSPF